MASHETASVAVFPTNLQTHGGNLMKEASVTLPPPANSVQHLSCPSTSQSPAVKVMEKAYTPQNMSPAKPAGKSPFTSRMNKTNSSYQMYHSLRSV